MDTRFVYVTASSRDEARRIGRALVEDRLIACANVIDGISSLYWWDGQVQEDQETVLILKTCDDLVDAMTRRIQELHSYECPCVIALPVVGGSQAYSEWIARETRHTES